MHDETELSDPRGLIVNAGRCPDAYRELAL